MSETRTASEIADAIDPRNAEFVPGVDEDILVSVHRSVLIAASDMLRRAQAIETAACALLTVISRRGTDKPLMNTKLSAVRALHIAIAMPLPAAPQEE